MAEPAALLAALQHADSFFPSGGIAFSWGLESLHAEGAVGRSDIETYLAAQLQCRWNRLDRAVLSAAHRHGDELPTVLELDWLVESMTWPREARDGSRRLGAALLNIHQRLGTAGAADYRQLVREGKAAGHLPVLQGLLWRATGMTQELAVAASAHAFCIGLLGAAVRLGVIGHIESQRALMAAHHVLVDLLAEPVMPVAEMGAFAPATDIAMMRHETQATRLFSN